MIVNLHLSHRFLISLVAFSVMQIFLLITHYSPVSSLIGRFNRPNACGFRGSQSLYRNQHRERNVNEILYGVDANFFRRFKRAMSINADGSENLNSASTNGLTDNNAYSLNAKTTVRKTVKKLLPLGAMLFFILFNYTILRDTKDVLVVTAPNSGAEIIPFLKTYVNLPSAVIFSLLYSSLCNKMATDKVFYIVMSAFLSFFAAFAGLICKSYLQDNLFIQIN